MATKDISDIQVCLVIKFRSSFRACMIDAHLLPDTAELLEFTTGQPYKVCLSALKRTLKKGYTDYGSSLSYSFLTEKGEELVYQHEFKQACSNLRPVKE